MKKFVFFLIFSLIVTLGYSQVADVGEFRIANATTAFGRNLPVGTKVYNIADGKYWVAIDGVGKTETLTTGAAKFDLLNVKVRAEDVPIDDLGGFYTGTDVEAALQEVGDSISQHRTEIDILKSQTSGHSEITESFEESSGTATTHNLTKTAIVANGCRVSFNGATLSPDKYTLTSSTIKVSVPVLKYDEVIITYTY